MDSRLRRKLQREREERSEHVLVGIDQSFSNCAMVKFVNGIPTDRFVIHTGNPTATKNKHKTYGMYFESPALQLNYVIEMFMEKMEEWNPDQIALEGLSFGSTSSSIFQLGALYFGLQIAAHRELGLPFDSILTVTPAQAKNTARSFLINGDQYEREKTGEVIRLKSGKPKLKKMDKPDMLKALENTPYGWLVDGYTRDGLVAARSTPTGIADIPDGFWIAVYTLEKEFKYKFDRPKEE